MRKNFVKKYVAFSLAASMVFSMAIGTEAAYTAEAPGLEAALAAAADAGAAKADGAGQEAPSDDGAEKPEEAGTAKTEEAGQEDTEAVKEEEEAPADTGAVKEKEEAPADTEAVKEEDAAPANTGAVKAQKSARQAKAASIIKNGDFQSFTPVPEEDKKNEPNQENILADWIQWNALKPNAKNCEAQAQLEEGSSTNYVAYITRGEIAQELTLEPFKRYEITGRYKSDTTGRAIIFVQSEDGSLTEGNTKSVCQVKDEWQDAKVTFAAPENGKVTLVVKGYIRQKCWFDDLEIREIPTDYAALTEVLDRAEATVKEEGAYTPETWAAYEAAYNTAVEVQGNKDALQYQVDEAAVALSSALAGLVLQSPEGAVTYYIDSVNGNDEADGLSPETAWKTPGQVKLLRLGAGDKILLKAGSVWNGEHMTVIQAAGEEGNPVVIGMYGEGPLPILNGQGANWETSRRQEQSTVHLVNCSNIIVENLEVTNYDSETQNYGSAKIPRSEKFLSAILVEGRDAGRLANVTVRNNVVHDVNGKKNGGKEAGGIIFIVESDDYSNKDNVTWFDNVTITENEVYDVCHEAIETFSFWGKRPMLQQLYDPWVGWDNVYIAHNYVHHTAGDGILVCQANDAVVEYNLLDGVANEDWEVNGQASAALWCWDTDNVIMQYNEVCNTQTSKDGMAFDFDYGIQNCMYQYNISRNNKGGFAMVCPAPDGVTMNCVIRYNVSINDGGFDGTRILRFGGKNSWGIQVYNNTIYWADSIGENIVVCEKGTWDGGDSRGTQVFNNIFYGPSTNIMEGEKDENGKTLWPTFAVNGITYYNNCVYGGCEEAYERLAEVGHEDEEKLVADPQFVDPTEFTAGSFHNHRVTLGTADGFKLKETSPCINAGAEIPNAPYQVLDAYNKGGSMLGDYVPTTIQKPQVDFYGIKVNCEAPNIGAYEGEKDQASAETADGVLSAVIEGNLSLNSYLVIEPIGTEEEDAKALAEKLTESMELFGIYDISVRGGKAEGPFALTLKVGVQYNGRNAMIYHRKDDGTIEEFQAVVENGKISFTVDTLSPFMIAFAKQQAVDPGEDEKPGDNQNPGGNEKPGDDQNPGGNEKPGDNQNPGGNENPGGTQKPDNSQKPGNSNSTNGTNNGQAGNNAQKAESPRTEDEYPIQEMVWICILSGGMLCLAAARKKYGRR